MKEKSSEPSSAGLVIEAGIAKFPSGRSPAEARAAAEAAYRRAPSGAVHRIARGTPLSEVNALDIAPGDAVLFERGGVWRGQLRVRSGLPGHPVRYGAFGSGGAPVIQPSLDRGDPADWREESGGVWSAAGGSSDIGNVILDHGDSGYLFRRERPGELRDDRDYAFDAVAGRVFVRSDAGNPAVRWRSVEFALKIHAIDEGFAHDVVYESLSLRYAAAHGIGGSDVARIAVRDCDVAWIGGGYLYVDTLGHGVRYGNGIELWGGAEDVVVEGCRAHDCWDAGLTNQSNVPGSEQRNLLWRGNRVERCEYSYEFWQQGEGGACENVRLEDNDFRDAGGGWGHAQRWNPNAAHLMLYDTTVPTPGFAVVRNRFERSRDCLCRAFNDWEGRALFSDNVWVSGGEPHCRCHARPRTGLRNLYPDHLDQMHRDDAAEIESEGPGGWLRRDRFPWEAPPRG